MDLEKGRGKFVTQTHRREDHTDQAKESLEPPEAGRDSFVKLSEGPWPC